jgi:hypothetical protein
MMLGVELFVRCLTDFAAEHYARVGKRQDSLPTH